MWCLLFGVWSFEIIACWLLRVIPCCLQVVGCCLLFDVWCLWFDASCVLLVLSLCDIIKVRFVLFAVCRLSDVGCWFGFVVGCMCLFNVCRGLVLICLLVYKLLFDV